MIDLTNLRTDVPVYDTPALERDWRRVFCIFEREDELEVPCAMPLGVRRILFQICRSMSVHDVLEIGTYTGTSALAFALAVKPCGRVVSVDVEDVNSPEAFWKFAGRSGCPRDLMERCDVSFHIDFVAMDSQAFMANSSRKFDFICIDGHHEEESVYKEIPLAIACLKPGGLIFFDDVQTNGAPPGLDKIPGPLNAIKRHLDEGLQVDMTYISKTIEGEPTAVAFMTRRA